jgi:hypothetical protein
LRVTYTPTIAEHFRATAALHGTTPVFDPVAALPYILACLLLSGVLADAAWGIEAAGFTGFAPILFLVGVGIQMRQGLGREVTLELGEDAIEMRQPRHRWSVPWSRISRVEETPEFFLISTPGLAFYLPKRALEDDGAVAALRDALSARRG